MTDLLAPPARLITAFGTVLYVDVASGGLRHGPIESAPANAVFLAEPNTAASGHYGYLVHDTGAASAPIVCLPNGCHSLSRAEGDKQTATALELIALERGLICFKAGDLFLSAFPDGRVLLNAPACSTWELFLASQDWCTEFSAHDEEPWRDAGTLFDKKKIESYIIHPTLRARANTKPKAIKILIYGYTKWSHGRIYYGLCKHLHHQGYIVDILDWQAAHAEYINQIIPYYDLFMTALDGVSSLIDVYKIPHERIIAVSHHELDKRMLIDQKGLDVFDKFASYVATSEFIYCASLMSGIRRVPVVASIGIDFAEFYSEISDCLATVGYASSMSTITYGIEWKRGKLAEAAAREAGLPFRIAGWTGNQISFHDMPDFYRSVDAVLTSSISEAAQLPVMEAAAAGRLVIGTPVGHFPLKAYQGGGVIAPVEAEKFKAFTAATLRYYKENPAAYVDKCHSIQEAAQRFDWQHSIGEWVDLIETAWNAGN
jgi:hypothetical protein